jgi:hypothetical protein
VVVRQNLSRRTAIELKRDGSHAVGIPPELPTASTVEKSARLEGRKETAAIRSIELSLVSWIHTIEGEADEIASRGGVF